MDRAWLLPEFHCKIVDWWELAVQAAFQPTYLDDIVRRKPTHIWLCDASDIGAGGVWLDLARSGRNLVWRHPWQPDTITYLFSLKNLEVKITNYDLDLAALIFHKAALLVAVPIVRVDAPHSRSANTSTVSWSTYKASTINPVVVELLHIRTLHARHVFLNPSIFYHPG